ncbi:MAG: tRNA (N6-isopentenyl adenosine(37)-C2)-methylthiotransferase MiaB [Acidimicrobiia bacterium]|nr:tRNA (N6-isopentenyl adenosine(37)-C2)-methylthiotransferase MiaB [Acidimicrobiia bacterium]
MTARLAPPERAPGRVPARVGQRYLVRTFGCQMNEHDSERVAGLFAADGMTVAVSVEDADVVFLNTCCIRENADDRLYGTLGHLKAAKRQRPGLRIVVGGCLAQKDRDLVRRRAPWVDVVFGTHNLHRVLDLLDHADEWGPITEILESSAEADAFSADLPSRRELDHAAWVTITVGCNNACTFCIVPIVRGPEVSRRPGEIIEEVGRLAADGVVEVTLLGQNVNSYGRDLGVDGRHRPVFAELLRRVGEVPGIRRVRFTSPHPKDMREDVARAMAETTAVCEHLHLPLQSGSARILRAMHRGYTPRRFLDRLEMMRRIVPGLAVTTDVIVGFPGETESDFRATLEVMEEARFDGAYMFIYSPRPGTPAAAMEGQVAPEVAAERFSRLADLQQEMSLSRNRELVGGEVEVLTEGPSRKDPSMATARTRTNKVVHLPGEFPPGTFLRARLERAAPSHLIGRAVP